MLGMDKHAHFVVETYFHTLSVGQEVEITSSKHLHMHDVATRGKRGRTLER